MTHVRHFFMIAAMVFPGLSAFASAGPPETLSLSLDGQWSLAVDSGGVYTVETVRELGLWRNIDVPGSWQAQCADLRDYQGVAWYRKSFDPPKMRRGESAVLTFGAVDYRADVFMNGVKAGGHEGGYTPFRCEVGALLHEGTNELMVRVMDPVFTDEGTEGIRYRNIPHGKQNWYVQTSGLWQSVRLDVVPPRRITGVAVTPSMAGTVDVTLRLSSPMNFSANNRVAIHITDDKGSTVAQTKASIPVRDSLGQYRLEVKNPALWTLDTPHLYQIQATLDANPPVGDRFGFRSIETRDGKILLNGKPFYLIGALDQDFYPESIYSTPSESYLRDEMLKAKQIGLNTLRCHIKAPDPLYLKVADEVGLLVWYEIPNWDILTPEAGRRGEQTLREMLERDWNHPSLVILSIINESWGVDLKKKEQREWLRGAFDRVKAYATGRLVVDNSACRGNFHLKTDLNDYHLYFAMPDQHKQFDRLVAEMASRPGWLFSPHGDAVTTRAEPLLLSEFGTWGLPAVPQPAPWWIERGFGKSETVMPKGYEERFARYKLESVFGSYREMLGVSQRAQTDALKYQIEQLRFTPRIEGYVITEFTDINWECNGVLDMWRNVKDCGRVLPVIQQQDVIVARPVRTAWWSDEQPTIEVRCSRYSAESAAGVTVHWRTSRQDSGSMQLGGVTAGTVSIVPPLHLAKPGVRPDNTLRVDVRMVSAGGKQLASNSAELTVYSRDAVNEAAPGRPVAVSSRFDSTMMAGLNEGQAVLLLMDSTTVFPAGFPMVPVRRDTGGYGGDWASAVNWVRSNRSPFRGVCTDHRIGFEGAGARMPFAIRGIDPANYEDVLAGMFVGWVQKNAAYVVQMKVGKGKLVLCALPLHWTADADPFSATLLHRLKQYAGSIDCQPKWVWNP
jgi:hypothetical protein